MCCPSYRTCKNCLYFDYIQEHPESPRPVSSISLRSLRVVSDEYEEKMVSSLALFTSCRIEHIALDIQYCDYEVLLLHFLNSTFPCLQQLDVILDNESVQDYSILVSFS